MESQNYLGIYISKDTATVVCLGSQGGNGKVLGCFSVSVEGQEDASRQVLASLIAQGCAERGLEFFEAAVALDCGMFMQHHVHSEFSEPKRIAATIRFDTEEALATDISDVAIAFQITSIDQTGSELTVFTAQRKILSDVLLSLQSNNIDPITIEPDVNCLSRFICQNASLSESRRIATLFALLSRHSGYLVVPPLSTKAGSQKASTVRTFLVGPAQGRGDLLAREALVTTALTDAGEPISRLKVFDSAGSVNCQQLSERLSIEAGSFDLAGSVAADPQTLADCAEPVDFAIAYGAALTHLEKAQSINFRNDFMPYQGRKLRLQKALKFASISVTVLLLAVGLYFQSQLLRTNKNRSRLSGKFAKGYSAVMFGNKPPSKTNPVRKLESEWRRIRAVKKGLLGVEGEESISSKLTLVLKAFNSCATRTNLNIDSVTITDRGISIVGNTSSRTNTLRLFDAIKKNGLVILQQRLYPKDRRDNFGITVEPKK